MGFKSEKLDFAYKFPFSDEAKEIITSLQIKRVEDRYLNVGKLRFEEAMDNDSVGYFETNFDNIKITSLISYVYARMLVSSFNNFYLTNKYAEAEGKRAQEIIAKAKDTEMMAIAKEFGIEVLLENQSYTIPFQNYIKNAPRLSSYSLIHQKLGKGRVYLTKERTAGILGEAAKRAVLKGLPIAKSLLPKEVVDFAKTVKVEIKIEGSKDEIRGDFTWIEKLLSTPIADCRHRTVNMILAPYLVNVKKMSVEEAADKIIKYIDQCKIINPDTKVNETYIRYQCRYAKAKGLRPYSQIKAKELLKSHVGIIFEEN